MTTDSFKMECDKMKADNIKRRDETDQHDRMVDHMMNTMGSLPWEVEAEDEEAEAAKEMEEREAQARDRETLATEMKVGHFSLFDKYKKKEEQKVRFL